MPMAHIKGTWTESLFPADGPDPTEAEYRAAVALAWRNWAAEQEGEGCGSGIYVDGDDDDSEGSGSGIYVVQRWDLNIPMGPAAPGGPGGPEGPGRPGATITAASQWMQDYVAASSARNFPEAPGGPEIPVDVGSPQAFGAWTRTWLQDTQAPAWIGARDDYRQAALQQGDEVLQGVYRNLEENPSWVHHHANPTDHAPPPGPAAVPPSGPAEDEFQDVIIEGLQALPSVIEELEENELAELGPMGYEY